MNLRTLSFLFALLVFTAPASAITLTPGTSWTLGGNVTAYPTQNKAVAYTVLGSSTLTVNNNSTVSAVINLLAGDGTTATLTIDNLIYSGTGSTKTLTPTKGAGIKVYPSGCVHIGNLVTSTGITTDFTISTSSGSLNTASNILSISSTTYYALNPAMTFLGRVGLTLSIGGQTGGTNVPEPMSMSLLGMGLIGGLVSRKRKSA